MKLSKKCLESLQFVIKNPVKKHPLPPLPTASDLVKLYRVRATKQLAQNFLYDPGVINRFIRCLSSSLSGYHVCEVGPGPGSITRGILQNGADHVTIIEKDSRFLPILQYIADVVDGRLSIVHGDILKFDIKNSFPEHLAKDWHDDCPPFCVLGNLPFNISLPLLFQWLDLISKKDGMFKLGRIPFVLTFQCEIAERLTAGPGHPQRSRLSVTSQYLCDITHHFTVNGGAFIPRPKVEVGVVKIVPKKEFKISLPFYSVDHVAKHLLSGRKKPCGFGVSTLFPPQRADLTDEMLRLSGVDPRKSSVLLTNDHFRDLCNAFEEIANKIPQLRLVDTYDPKKWLQHFDENGNPRETSRKEDCEIDNIRHCLRGVLNEDAVNGAPDVPRRVSRRQRKKLSVKVDTKFRKTFDDT